MNKYLFSFFLVFNSLLLAEYEDTSPSSTTKEDLLILQNLKDSLYNKTSYSYTKCNQEEIINYINLNKIKKFAYNKLLVKLNSQISTSENFTEDSGAYRERDRASLTLNASYPLFDKKTDLEIKKKKIEYRSSLIDEVAKYCKTKLDIDILINKIDILNLKQIRAKAREESGQIFLDERITLIEEIITKKSELANLDIEFKTIKLQLLNKVKSTAKKELDELL